MATLNSITSALDESRDDPTEMWNLGHNEDDLRRKFFRVVVNGEYPAVSGIGLSEKAFRKPVLFFSL